jgi:glyoxylase-like metal-dependent hydrolase (beta-lactamase superfamily II)
MIEPVAPGVHAWETKDFKQFRAFAVADGGEVVLIDPVAPDADEARAIAALGRVVAIVLTSSWHERDAEAIARRFEAPIYAHPAALGELSCKTVQPLPAVLPLGLAAWEVPGAFPGQVAYYRAHEGGSLIVGDCWMNLQIHEKPLPVRLLMKYLTPLRDGLHLTPPGNAADSQAIIAAYREHLAHPVERLLVSHGRHILAGARAHMLARLEQGA